MIPRSACCFQKNSPALSQASLFRKSNPGFFHSTAPTVPAPFVMASVKSLNSIPASSFLMNANRSRAARLRLGRIKRAGFTCRPSRPCPGITGLKLIRRLNPSQTAQKTLFFTAPKARRLNSSIKMMAAAMRQPSPLKALFRIYSAATAKRNPHGCAKSSANICQTRNARLVMASA